jgi:dimethylaniline monooxygenase (N-oxide forming)
MHAESFTDGKQAEGKKVIVVGGGKSAIDCAVVAGKYGESSTLLFRHSHWPVPRYLANLIPFKWATYSRFGHFTLNEHYDVSPVASVLHKVFSPLKYAYWRIVETMFKA